MYAPPKGHTCGDNKQKRKRKHTVATINGGKQKGKV